MPKLEITTAGEHPRQALTTWLIVVTGSVLFCSKGVFAKLLYAEGLDAIEVLNLRMLTALPFFVGMVWWKAGGFPRMPCGEWLRFALLGFLGYYISSYVNFTGLKYVSVGMERIILYTYPTMVLVLSVGFLKVKVGGRVWLAAAVAWLGICVSFYGEAQVMQPWGTVLLGGGLIFLSAMTYAVFLLVSKRTLDQHGAMLFTGGAGAISCLFMIIHFGLIHEVGAINRYSFKAWIAGAYLGIFGTVLPIFLMGLGLKRAGPQRFAVMGSVGPVATLLLAWVLLGEQPYGLQIAGLGMAILGSLGVAQVKQSNARHHACAKRPSR